MPTEIARLERGKEAKEARDSPRLWMLAYLLPRGLRGNRTKRAEREKKKKKNRSSWNCERLGTLFVAKFSQFFNSRLLFLEDDREILFSLVFENCNNETTAGMRKFLIFRSRRSNTLFANCKNEKKRFHLFNEYRK